MAEFTGRILPLLWRRSIPARKATGRPPRLSVDLVVTTGIRIADGSGLEAASMAQVAAALSVATMTLYTYVPSRPELIDLMVDEVMWARDLGGPRPAGWRDQITSYASRTFAMYRAHPWVAEVSLLRPPLGPGMLAEREYLLAAMTSAGLPTRLINSAAWSLAGWVASAARTEAEDALLRRSSGLSSDEWWGQRGELWDKWFSVDDHPAMTALWNAGAFDRNADEQARDAYEFGLSLLLDGIEAQTRGQ